MKKVIYIFILCSVLIACADQNRILREPEVGNTRPSTPSYIDPKVERCNKMYEEAVANNAKYNLACKSNIIDGKSQLSSDCLNESLRTTEATDLFLKFSKECPSSPERSLFNAR